MFSVGGASIYWKPPGNIGPDLDHKKYDLFFSSQPQVFLQDQRINLTIDGDTASMFLNNTALYGASLASPPFSLQYENNFYQEFLHSSLSHDLLIDSGEYLNFHPTIELVDVYRNRVKFPSQVVIRANAPVLFNNRTNITLTGSIVEVEAGLAHFRDLTITAPPGTRIQIQFSAQIPLLQNNFILNQTLIYRINHCPMGTYLTDKQVCHSCPNNLYSYQIDSLECSICEATIHCLQPETTSNTTITTTTAISTTTSSQVTRTEMFAKEGYWLYHYEDKFNQTIVTGTVKCPPHICLDKSRCQTGK